MGATKQGDSNMANIIYILYLVGLATGITELVGVILAYINRKDAEGWMETHYTFQIRTFWIGLLMVIVGVILSFVVIGFALLLFYYVWLIMRCVKGMQYLNNQQPHPNPDTWMFN